MTADELASRVQDVVDMLRYNRKEEDAKIVSELLARYKASRIDNVNLKERLNAYKQQTERRKI